MKVKYFAGLCRYQNYMVHQEQLSGELHLKAAPFSSPPCLLYFPNKNQSNRMRIRH